MPAHKKEQARILPVLRKVAGDPIDAIRAALKDPDPRRREQRLLAMNVAYVVAFRDSLNRPKLYRIQVIRADGASTPFNRPTIEEVAEARIGAEIAQRANAQMNVRQSIEAYLKHAIRPTGQADASIETIRGRLRAILEPVLDLPVTRLTKDRARRLYEGRASAELGPDGQPLMAEKGYIQRDTKKTGKPPSPNTHIAALKAAKGWSAWLHDQGLLPVDIFAVIKQRGRPKKGGFGKTDNSYEEQILLDQTCERVMATLHQFPEKKQLAWHQRAVAIMMALRMGVRSKELRSSRRRQLTIIRKNDGTVWGILEITRDNAKTGPSVRKLPVRPETMRHLLPLAEGKKLEQFLFAGAPRGPLGGLGGPNWQRDPDYPLTERWLDNSLARMSKMAGIRRDNPHGLRGAFNDLSRRGGADLEAASKALGHGGTGVTQAAYENQLVAAESAQRQVAEHLGLGAPVDPGKGSN